MNLNDVGPRADMFSLGVVFAAMANLTFAFVGAEKTSQQLQALCQSLGHPGPDGLPKDWRPHFRGMPKAASRLDCTDLRLRHGAPAQQLLERLLEWLPQRRLSSIEASCHVFPRGGRLLGLGPLGEVETYEGQRHKWTARTACLDQDVLVWLQEGVSMDLVSGTPDAFGKYAIAGCTDEACEGSFLNGRSIKQLVPAPRVRAWIRAFRDVNKHVIANMYVQASRRVERMEGVIGPNGRHFPDTP